MLEGGGGENNVASGDGAGAIETKVERLFQRGPGASAPLRSSVEESALLDLSTRQSSALAAAPIRRHCGGYRAFPQPRCFGALDANDRRAAMGELPKGIPGETLGLSYRDFAAPWVDGQGSTYRSTQNKATFPRHLLDRDEKRERSTQKARYVGPPEFRTAALEVGAPRDETQPGNEKQNGRAERANGLLLDGARRDLLQTGLPEPRWPHVLRSFALCCNVGVGQFSSSARFRRLGEPFYEGARPFPRPDELRAACSRRGGQIQDRPSRCPGIYFGLVWRKGRKGRPRIVRRRRETAREH